MQNSLIRLFNDIAPTYDLLNHLFSFMCDHRWRKLALQAIDIKPHAVVLDVCTGTADVAIRMAAHYRTGRIVGIDLAEKMLQIGRTKISREKLSGRIELIKADALQLPFSDDSFDILCMSFGLRNLTNRQKGLQEMKRVLKENGQIVFLEFSPPESSFFGKLYRLYLGRVIPFAGGIVSQSASAYSYLASSIEHFPAPEEIVRLLQDTGLQKISCKRLMFGIVYLYIVRKIT